jgi:hypothetical protein
MCRIAGLILLVLGCNCQTASPHHPIAEILVEPAPAAKPALTIRTSDTVPASKSPTRPWTEVEIADYTAECLAKYSHLEILPGLIKTYCECKADRLSRLFSAGWLGNDEPANAMDNTEIAGVDEECKGVVSRTL